MSTHITSLHNHIAQLAKAQPNKAALLKTNELGDIVETVTYRDLEVNMHAAAVQLKSMGLERGDRIALAFRNSPALLIWSWAAWACGIVTVPMDTKRDTQDLYEYKINLNKAKCLILEQGIRAEKMPGVRFHVHTEFAPAPETAVAWEEGTAHQALVLFTSGTTGHPKGAMLSLENLVVNAGGICEWLRIIEEDVFMVNLPLHHINSTTFCLSTLLSGGTVAIPPQYSNSHFWHQVAKTHATITSVVQSIVFDQLHREAEYESVKKSVRLTRMQIGSAPVMAQSVIEFRKKFGVSIYQGYGQTETALRVTGVPMGLPETFYNELIESNSIGAAMKWADLQIADEKGAFLGEGEEGELVVKGAAVMEGYLGREPAFRDEYFLTGDIGYFKTVDGIRYFYLKGRKREIIIKGGVNVSPIAVENALQKISTDIDQAHVVAVPDERYGEEVGAVITWKKDVDQETAKRILKCSLLFGTPYLSAYETPKYITSMEVSELPMTSTGKVQRSVLKTSIPYEKFESIYGLVKTPEYRFSVLHRFSRWTTAAYELHNLCWSPIVTDREVYEKNIDKQRIILAARPDDSLAGHIAVIRTSLTKEQLLAKKYSQLLDGDVLDRTGDSLVCISICSADFKPKPVPHIDHKPTPQDVREYIETGKDPVMRFHQKPKGGEGGAELVGIIEDGRPEDESACGYNMLLQYPAPASEISIADGAPVSNQLIELVLLLAKDLGIKNVYAFSRPGGLAAHVSAGA